MIISVVLIVLVSNFMPQHGASLVYSSDMSNFSVQIRNSYTQYETIKHVSYVLKMETNPTHAISQPRVLHSITCVPGFAAGTPRGIRTRTRAGS